MAFDPEQLPRGIAVSRREQPAPWEVAASARAHVAIHVALRGAFELVQDGLPPRAVDAGDIVLVDARRAGPTKVRCVEAHRERDARAELITAEYVSVRDHAVSTESPVLHLRAEDTQRERGISIIVSLLRAALTESNAAREHVARALLEPLLAYVLEYDADAHPAGARQPHDPRIARALERLRSNLGDAWTVEKLAKAAGLSRAAFARRFLAELGVSPLRYVTELRMERAARLLAETDASLAGIAAEIGYESEFAFSRAFKRHTGEAPGVYRRARRAERITMRASCVRAAA